jgi:hypothetical protein
MTVYCPFQTWQKNLAEAVVLEGLDPFDRVVVLLVVLLMVGEAAVLVEVVVSDCTLGKLGLARVWAKLLNPMEEAIAIVPARPTENISRKSALIF